MAGDDHVDHRLRQGVRHMPTEQDSDTQAENPAVSHHYRRGNAALPKNSNGPDYGITETQRERCHPHYRGPRMFESRNIPPLFNHHHRTRNRTIIHGPRVPMVRTPLQNNQRSRPPLYVSLRQSPQSKTGDPTESVHGVPPPN